MTRQILRYLPHKPTGRDENVALGAIQRDMCERLRLLAREVA